MKKFRKIISVFLGLAVILLSLASDYENAMAKDYSEIGSGACGSYWTYYTKISGSITGGVFTDYKVVISGKTSTYSTKDCSVKRDITVFVNGIGISCASKGADFTLSASTTSSSITSSSTYTQTAGTTKQTNLGTTTFEAFCITKAGVRCRCYFTETERGYDGYVEAYKSVVIW